MTRHAPDRATFVDLCRSHPVVPVWREILADTQTPVAAYLRLAEGMDDAFLLESVEGGERWARYSFLGGDHFGMIKAKDGRITISGDPPTEPRDGEPPLAYTRRLLSAWSAPALRGLPPLHGGAVGCFGYDCVRELEKLPDPPPDDLGLPDLALLLTRTLVVFDHLAQSAFVITNVVTPRDPRRAYDEAIDRCDEMADRLSRPLGLPPIGLELDASQRSARRARAGQRSGRRSRERDVEFSCPVDDAVYEDWVKRSKEFIYAGDIFQVVPSRRFEAPLGGSAFGAYRALRALNPSPYMYYLRFGGTESHEPFEIAGASPEPLVRVTGREIVTRPIAGTRPRGAGDEEDRALERELLEDEKERAEHVMLVDLARNDVGRVAEYGSVEVDELMVVERYSHVMHLVSNVSGRLAPGKTAFDALTACFPAGTVSGAPKVRAMEIIDSLERTRRGPYAGVVGYFDFSGNLDTCIAIRTVVATGGKAYVQAGAGIVADSVPESEADETRRKAEGVLKAVAAASAL